MRVVHLSDLHFGTVEPALAVALLRDIVAVRPDAVAVSGDLTQRARRHELLAARDFLRRLPAPVLAVPGNHDLAPLYRPLARLAGEPLAGFKELIEPDPYPFLAVGRLAMLGIATPRAALPAGGRVSREQLEHLRARFAAIPDAVYKVVVAHHPFLSPTYGKHHRVVRRADEALLELDAARVDLLLAGHFHVNFARGAHASMGLRGHTLVVQAGTALSNRTRGEANSYNVIELDGAEVRLEVRRWDGARFREGSLDLFRRDRGPWQRVGGRVRADQPG